MLHFRTPAAPLFLIAASLIPIISADIVYLADCSYQNFGYAAMLFYNNAPNGNQAPAPQNIAVVASDGPEPWAVGRRTLQGYFFVTREIFSVDPLNGAAERYQFAGLGHNSGGSWNCYKDNGNAIYNDGTWSCNRDYYCLPVSLVPWFLPYCEMMGRD
jgi:hypothetical protein